MSVDRYQELAVFAAVAEHGAIGRAGEAIGLSASQVSRTLTQLEKRLGVQLVHRTTRRLALTEEGRALHERARGAFADLDEAESAVGCMKGTARGRLRVTLPVQYGHRYIAPLAARFASENALVHVELAFDDRKVDLVEEGYDVGVRVGIDDDPSLVARRLSCTRVLILASPAYLERAGTPAEPADLADHATLPSNREDATATWSFPGGATVRLSPRRFTANSGFALREAALAGLGVVRLPDFMVDDDLAAGRLVRILGAWERELAIAAVYPPARHLAPKVRQFVDFLAAELPPSR
jgi:DNA-binding transcriptional LysR family regulator